MNRRATRIVFEPADLQLFAALSHDRNPLHLDTHYAQRTPYGECLVHGALGLLFCMRDLVNIRPIRFTSVEATFTRPMFVNTPYEVELHFDGANRVVATLGRMGIERVRAEFRYELGGAPSDSAEPFSPGYAQRLDAATLNGTEFRPFGGKYAMATEALSRMKEKWHFDYSHLPLAQLSSLLWSSYLVGMEVPGRQALFQALKCTFDHSGTSPSIAYAGRVDSYDPDASSLTLSADLQDGARPVARFTISSAIRPGPIVQSLASLREHVGTSTALAGKVAFVTGASRGLGSLLAVGCSLHGADVILHCRNETTEIELVKELVSRNGRRALVVRGDIADRDTWTAAQTLLASSGNRLDIFINNAFPSLAATGFVDLPEAALDKSLQLVRGMALGMRELLPLLVSSSGIVINISSEWTQNPPRNFSHYVLAKSALEALVLSVSREYRAVDFVTVRPPRLMTDMANSVMSSLRGQSPEPVVREILQAITGRRRNPASNHSVIDRFPNGHGEGSPTRAEVEAAVGATLYVAATFTAEPLETTLRYWLKRLGMEWHIAFAPYNRVFQELLDPAAPLARSHGTKAVLIRLEDLGDELERGVHDLAEAVSAFTTRSPGPLVICICPPSRSVVDDPARSALERQLGDALISRLRGISGVVASSARELLGAYPVQDVDDLDAYDEMKVPYTGECLAAIATYVMRLLHAAHRDPYKVIVLDCDNTLWDGVVGEDGPDGIQFPPWRRELQRFMLERQAGGMLLCLASKNIEKDVVDAIESRDEMLVKQEHIVASRINWLPKSENLRSLADELNLGLDSFIFVDDSPVECAEVVANCPGVVVAQLPAERSEIPAFLRSFWAFDRRSGTAEDSKRTHLYKVNAEREQFRRSAATFADFLEALDLNVTFTEIDERNLPRVAQLTQRTNQFNCTTYRRTDAEIDAFLKSRPGNGGFVVAVKDRFGDYGVVGAALFQAGTSSLSVDTFVLSCRALGRGVEHRVVRHLAKLADARGLATIELAYRPTEKNRPARDFLESLGSVPEPAANGVTIFRMSTAAGNALVYRAPTTAPIVPSGEERPQARTDGADGKRVNPELWMEIASQSSTPRRIVAAVRGSSHAVERAPQVGSQSAAFSGGAPVRWDGISDVVRKEVASLLGVHVDGDLDPRAGFFLLGMDSVEVPGLAGRLTAQLGVEVPVSAIFKYPTIDALTGHIASELGLTRVEQTPTRAVATHSTTEPIAVVGVGCRFPGGSTGVDAFWDLLNESRDAVRPIPASRWNVDALYDADPDAKGKTYVRAAALLDDPDAFDPGFFGISPREAPHIDPQQRLLLQTSIEALEHAGVNLDELRQRTTGVFIGMLPGGYGCVQRGEASADIDAHDVVGNMASMAAGRLSFALGVQGPSFVVDTACSASLAAIHLACASLRAGECDVALSGGAMLLSLSWLVAVSRLHALSPDGRCKTFSANADGFGWGEGSGVVVLKRLSTARADGDRIIGLIRGSAINHDGSSAGLTVPNGDSQQRTIRAALASANLSPTEIGYVECHGTGTILGDPIEVDALAHVYGRGRTLEQPLYVGSVKTNIGHLEAAAGVAGLIKGLLTLQRGRIPATLRAEPPNPHIQWSPSLKVASSGVDWPRGAVPRRVGVSSFGLSGTNAHVILEEAPEQAVVAPAREPAAALVVLSGKTEQALDATVERMRAHVEAHGEQSLGDLGYSLATTRTHHEHRLALTARTREELMRALEACARGETTASANRGTARANRGKQAWLFTGQGAQRLGMGRELYGEWAAFRGALDHTCTALNEHLALPLLEVMWAEPGTPQAARLDQTEYTQPALFALEVALAALWRSWGVEPDYLLGHSIGELSAAYLAGYFSLEDAARLVAARGKLMQALPASGAMVAVSAPEATVLSAIAKHGRAVALAGVNGPESVVISGTEQAVVSIAESFASRGVRTKRLVVSHAFHSPLMDPMLEEFQKVAETVTYREPKIPVVSNVTGALGGAALGTAAYWVSHVRACVRFADGIRALHDAGVSRYLELGPKPTLSGLVPGCLPSGKDAEALLWTSLRADRTEPEAVLDALGGYHSNGGTVDWKGVFPAGRRRVELPMYAWQRQRYWIETTAMPASGHAEEPELHVVNWEAAAKSPKSRATLPSGRWVVVGANEDSLARAVAERVERAVGTCERAEASRIEEVLPADHVVCVWGETNEGTAEEIAAEALRVASEGLAVVQKLVNQAHAPRLWWVTRGAVADTASITCASLWGLGRTVMQEHPELRCTLVDVESGVAGAEAVVREISTGDDETEVAWRGGERRVARLVRAPVASVPVVRTDGTVLITGGLGELGLHVARWFAAHGIKHVVLTGRRGKDTPGASEAVKELEKLGARVTVEAVDITDRDALGEVLAAIPEDVPLRGVVHAAGVLEVGLLTAQSVDGFARVMAAKVNGALHLDALTRNAKLDFFVLFSSIAGTFGVAGQGPYAAANAFLDALAARRRAEGLPGQSLAWGMWTDATGKPVGLGSRVKEAQRESRDRSGLGTVMPSVGMALFEAALGRSEALLVAVPLRLRELRKDFADAIPPLWRSLIDLPRRVEEAKRGTWADDLRQLAPAERDQAVLEIVRTEVARVLSMASAEAVKDRPLNEMGLDSLMAVELRNALGKRTEIKLPATLAFDYPTPSAIRDYLVKRVTPESESESKPESTDRLESTIDLLDTKLARLGRIDEVRRIASRLRELAFKWSSISNEQPVDTSSINLSEISNRDLLGLIDQELDDN